MRTDGRTAVCILSRGKEKERNLKKYFWTGGTTTTIVSLIIRLILFKCKLAFSLLFVARDKGTFNCSNCVNIYRKRVVAIVVVVVVHLPPTAHPTRSLIT